MALYGVVWLLLRYGWLCFVLRNLVFALNGFKLLRSVFLLFYLFACSSLFVEANKMVIRASLKKNASAFFLFLSFINNNNNNIYRY